MKETKWYYDGVLKLIAKKLDIKDFEILNNDEIRNAVDNVDGAIMTLFEEFKKTYDNYNTYFEETYMDKPFTIEETEKYNNLSREMNLQRDKLLEKSNKKIS